MAFLVSDAASAFPGQIAIGGGWTPGYSDDPGTSAPNPPLLPTIERGPT